MDKDQIIEAIKAMTVLELNELVKACEEEFGVSAAAPVVVAGAAAGGDAAGYRADPGRLYRRADPLKRRLSRWKGSVH